MVQQLLVFAWAMVLQCVCVFSLELNANASMLTWWCLPCNIYHGHMVPNIYLEALNTLPILMRLRGFRWNHCCIIMLVMYTVYYVMLCAEWRGTMSSARPWREGVSVKSLVVPVCAAGGWGDNSGVRDLRLEPPFLCHSHIVAMDTLTRGGTVKCIRLCHHSRLLRC